MWLLQCPISFECKHSYGTVVIIIYYISIIIIVDFFYNRYLLPWYCKYLTPGIKVISYLNHYISKFIKPSRIFAVSCCMLKDWNMYRLINSTQKVDNSTWLYIGLKPFLKGRVGFIASAIGNMGVCTIRVHLLPHTCKCMDIVKSSQRTLLIKSSQK